MKATGVSQTRSIWKEPDFGTTVDRSVSICLQAWKRPAASGTLSHQIWIPLHLCYP